MSFTSDTGNTNWRDIREFKDLFQSLYPKMMMLANRFVNENIAKDIVQEAFISLWEHKDSLDIRSIQSYLYRSVQNNCLNYIKHNRIVSDYEDQVRIAEARIHYLNEKTDDNEIFRMLEYNDIRSTIETSLAKLPPRCQEAFKLCYFHDLSYKEVAERMNISHRTVEVHVQRALAFLKENRHDLSILMLILGDFTFFP